MSQVTLPPQITPLLALLVDDTRSFLVTITTAPSQAPLADQIQLLMNQNDDLRQQVQDLMDKQDVALVASLAFSLNKGWFAVTEGGVRCFGFFTWFLRTDFIPPDSSLSAALKGLTQARRYHYSPLVTPSRRASERWDIISASLPICPDHSIAQTPEQITCNYKIYNQTLLVAKLPGLLLSSRGRIRSLALPVACRFHRPGSSKSFISVALGELSAGMKSKIPVLKNQVQNPKQRTPPSQMCVSLFSPELEIKSSQPPYDGFRQRETLQFGGSPGVIGAVITGLCTEAATANQPLFNENARLATRAVMTRKLSPSTSEYTILANSSVETRKFSPPTGQSVRVMSGKAVVTRTFSSLNTQSASVMANKSVVSDKHSPLTGQSTAIANNSVEPRKLSSPSSQPVSLQECSGVADGRGRRWEQIWGHLAWREQRRRR
ncbi:hypothetical protein EV426DRAFT_700940 [Tirmania nivea]|nr:hypothetical protein EV426DRAFT_700940 [Tirmania nivea]